MKKHMLERGPRWVSASGIAGLLFVCACGYGESSSMSTPIPMATTDDRMTAPHALSIQASGIAAVMKHSEQYDERKAPELRASHRGRARQRRKSLGLLGSALHDGIDGRDELQPERGSRAAY